MSAEQPIETWKEVEGFPAYRVSSLGRVETRWTPGSHHLGPEWKELRQRKTKKGHRYVDLYGNRIHVRRYVHQLVLEAFVGPCPEGKECCHWDDNPANNTVGNLRWGTPKENQEDCRRNGNMRRTPLFGSANNNAILNEETVAQIKRLAGSGISAAEVGRQKGTSKQNVLRIWKNRIWRQVQV